MEQPSLASLSLTHVHYNPNDSLSFASAWLALVPQALCVTYVALIWASREAEIVLMFVGQVGCEALNFILKRIIKEERPQQMNGKGYGMPSSHAQFVVYFAVYLSLFLIFRHMPTHPASKRVFNLLERVTTVLTLCFGSGVVAASRVYLNYHTSKQVSAGCATGMLCALGWFSITSFLRTNGWVHWILDFGLVRFFRIRDLVVCEDLAEAGWQRWEAKRNSKRHGYSTTSEPLRCKSE